MHIPNAYLTKKHFKKRYCAIVHGWGKTPFLLFGNAKMTCLYAPTPGFLPCACADLTALSWLGGPIRSYAPILWGKTKGRAYGLDRCVVTVNACSCARSFSICGYSVCLSVGDGVCEVSMCACPCFCVLWAREGFEMHACMQIAWSQHVLICLFRSCACCAV
jgi:hypothetical protein